MVGLVGFSTPSKPKDTQKETEKEVEKPSKPTIVAKSKEQKQRFLNELNKYRKSKGLKPVQFNSQFQAIADVRAKELGEHNYFEHIRPDMNTSIYNIGAYNGLIDGDKYFINGENLAGAYTSATSDTILQIWQNSPGHNRYLLNSGTEFIGLGIAEHPRYGMVAVLIGGYDKSNDTNPFETGDFEILD